METPIDATTDAILGDVARACGVCVYHAALRGATLRVEIDAEGGVSLETCGCFSRALDARLRDIQHPRARLPLEVSSPGVERRLRRPAHYVAAVGRLVAVSTGTEVIEGRLESADDEGFVVAGPSRARRLPYSEVRWARLKVADDELFGRRNQKKTTG